MARSDLFRSVLPITGILSTSGLIIIAAPPLRLLSLISYCFLVLGRAETDGGREIGFWVDFFPERR